MKALIVAVTLAGLLMIAAAVPTTARRDLASPSLPDLIARQRVAVVAVGTYNPLGRPTQQFLGTGFALSGRRLVATNWHVIQPILAGNREKELRVFSLSDRDSRGRAAILRRQDAEHDIELSNSN